jgi:amino acid transporter
MSERLQKDAIGLAPVLFQSITHMAPAAAVAFSIIFATTYAGGATPLAVVLALVACLFVAISIAQLARHLPSAGGLYTYSARGLHPVVGFFVAWGFMLAEPIVAPLLYLVFGNALASYLNAHFNTPLWLWAPFAALAGIGVWILVYRGVRISTEAGVALGAFEIIVFLALGITLIFAAGSNNTLSVFSPNTGNSSGLGSVFAGMVYTVLAFIGFEASAPLGEEARQPRRTIPRAVVGACLSIGIFYVICSYAWVVGTEGNFTEATLAQANPWRHLADVYWGAGWVLIFFAIINSALANSNAGVNAASRVIYAMGRNGVLPRAFGETHPVHKTPHVAIIAQTVLGIVVALLLGWKWSPLNAFGTLSYALTSLVIVVYMTVCVSTIVYYRREEAEFNVWLHGIVPALGALAFVPVLYYQFHPLPPYPLRYGNWGAILLFSLSALITLFMALRRRDRLNANLLFVADAETTDDRPPETAPGMAPA